MSDIILNEIRAMNAEIKSMNAEIKSMNARFEQMESSMNQRFVTVEERFGESEAIMESTKEQIGLIENDMNDCESDYSEHEEDMSDLDDFESFYIINESEDSFSFDTKFSELSTMDDQSELEIVNDIELDWGENIVFNHADIQPSKVRCLSLSFKNSCTTQQERNAMKYMATDVEVFSVNVLNVGTELNSFAQYEDILPRKVWDPGLDIMLL